MAAVIRIGTCAWGDHENFYPAGLKPGDRITYYSRFFPIVEVDSTFYALQPRRNFALWAQRTPPGFVFNVKAYGAMTRHHRQPRPGEEDVGAVFKQFAYAIEPLQEAGKLRTLHFQFPPWFTCRPENREWLQFCREFFATSSVAVEFRHRSWFDGEERTAETLRLLETLAAVHVIVDEPQVGTGSIPTIAAVTDRRLAIWRLHGRNARTWYIKGEKSADRFDYLYSRPELAALVDPIRALAAGVDEMHVLFNNNRENYAVRNALDLMELLGQPTPPRDARGVPAVPPDRPGPDPGRVQQARLF